MKYSDNGWSTEKIMLSILKYINTVAQNKKCVLILDCFSAHKTQKVLNYAKKLNIYLLYVPAGMTSSKQPLDVNINGPLKSIAKKKIKKIYIDENICSPKLKVSINILLNSLGEISTTTVKNSFVKALKN